jgi:hypothetical protein
VARIASQRQTDDQHQRHEHDLHEPEREVRIAGHDPVKAPQTSFSTYKPSARRSAR